MLYRVHGQDQQENHIAGFWSKSTPSSSADTYSPFEKQLLASYWATVGMEHLTMGHQVTMQPEPPLIN